LLTCLKPRFATSLGDLIMPKLEPIFTVKDLLILRFTLVILRYKNEVSALDAILKVQTSAFKLYFDIVAFENN